MNHAITPNREDLLNKLNVLIEKRVRCAEIQRLSADWCDKAYQRSLIMKDPADIAMYEKEVERHSEMEWSAKRNGDSFQKQIDEIIVQLNKTP